MVSAGSPLIADGPVIVLVLLWGSFSSCAPVGYRRNWRVHAAFLQDV